MRNVNRSPAPTILEENWRAWTKELMKEIKRHRKYSKVSRTIRNRYNHSDIRDALIGMYKGLCCYCEGRVGITSHQGIEHRMPKSIYPERSFEWINLHLICDRCNTKKGSKFNTDAEILDAVVDVPIEQHFNYDLSSGDIFWHPLTIRGTTTETHAGLNRCELLLVRSKLLAMAWGLCKKIANDPNGPNIEISKKKLEKLCDDQFGSFIRFVMQLENI